MIDDSLGFTGGKPVPVIVDRTCKWVLVRCMPVASRVIEPIQKTDSQTTMPTRINTICIGTPSLLFCFQ